METNEIWNLLVEAAEESCTEERAGEILQLLTNACASSDPVFRGSSFTVQAAIDTIALFMRGLFLATFEQKRENLPQLFPAFCMACGQREHVGDYTALIDWSPFG